MNREITQQFIYRREKISNVFLPLKIGNERLL